MDGTNMDLESRIEAFLSRCDEAMDIYDICLADGTILCDGSSYSGYRAFVNGETGFHYFMRAD